MLLAITPGDGRDLDPWIESLADAGLRAVLIREPHLGPEAFEDLARRAARRIEEVVLHETNPHAATTAARLGLRVHHRTASAHSAADLDRAFAHGARWALLSPVFRPTSKPDDERPPLGNATFLQWAAGRPVLALGGVTPERHGELLAKGAFGSAVLGALFGAPDPDAAANVLRRFTACGRGDSNPHAISGTGS